jgi:hypothetical protein
MQKSPMNTLRIADAVLDAERQDRLELVRLWCAADRCWRAVQGDASRTPLAASTLESLCTVARCGAAAPSSDDGPMCR